jgi:hypothetical protein
MEGVKYGGKEVGGGEEERKRGRWRDSNEGKKMWEGLLALRYGRKGVEGVHAGCGPSWLTGTKGEAEPVWKVMSTFKGHTDSI